MKVLLIFFALLSAQLFLASAEINVSGADMTYNASLIKADIQTPPQPVSAIFIYNDNGNGNSSLEPVQIPTAPLALSRIFSWNEASKNARSLVQGKIPTERKLLRRFFVVHEFAGFQRDLAYPRVFFKDTTPPEIMDVAVYDISSRQEKINWTTNEYATSQVKYGSIPGAFESDKRERILAMNHSVLLDGLMPGMKYYFAVNSTDRSGNSAESEALEFETSGL
jgi:hypothetical protein